MAFQATTARNYFSVLLAVAMATQFAACSRSGSGEGDGVTPGTGNGIADGPVQAATPPPAVTASDPADSDTAGTGANTPGSATVGGDGSDIVLAPLSSADIDGATLTGELGCSFSIGDAAPLLVAMGDVASKEPSRGVVKVGDYVETVVAPGGFDGMLEGAQFTGAGKVIRIAVTGPATGSGESPPVPATLTYDRADGARRSLAGQWRCGP